MLHGSSIRDLPPEVRAEVDRIFTKGVWTLDEIVDHLKAAGHPLSRPALACHQRRLALVSDRLRRSREVADNLARDLSPLLRHRTTRLMVIETLHDLSHELLRSSDAH